MDCQPPSARDEPENSIARYGIAASGEPDHQSINTLDLDRVIPAFLDRAYDLADFTDFLGLGYDLSKHLQRCVQAITHACKQVIGRLEAKFLGQRLQFAGLQHF